MISKSGDGAEKARTALRRVVAVLVLIGSLFAAGALPANAAPQPAQKASVVKTTPVPPTGVALGTVNVPKPRGAHAGVMSGGAWSMSLTASDYDPWPTRYTTLTATASADVGPTIYYIHIYNGSGALIGTCGSGTTCSVAVTSSTPGYQYFYANISDGAGGNVVAYTQTIDIDWYTAQLTLAAASHTVPVGGTTTLTETSNTDVGPSPFWVQIWDTTTGTELTQCGSGTTCSVTVSQSAATTHTYVATLAANTPSSGTYPPLLLQATSPANYVTWSGSGMQVKLVGSTPGYNQLTTVTASASIDVTLTPYWIEIFNTDGTELATCASGSTCTLTYDPRQHTHNDLVAFISSYSATLPPSGLQASSNTITTYYLYLG
jgi:hypothetical protein